MYCIKPDFLCLLTWLIWLNFYIIKNKFLLWFKDNKSILALAAQKFISRKNVYRQKVENLIAARTLVWDQILNRVEAFRLFPDSLPTGRLCSVEWTLKSKLSDFGMFSRFFRNRPMKSMLLSLQEEESWKI